MEKIQNILDVTSVGSQGLMFKVLILQWEAELPLTPFTMVGKNREDSEHRPNFYWLWQKYCGSGPAVFLLGEDPAHLLD